jgi:hypothetical protein
MSGLVQSRGEGSLNLAKSVAPLGPNNLYKCGSWELKWRVQKSSKNI